MSPAKSICTALLVITPFAPALRAQMHALDYDTPAYVDFEFSQVVVREDQPIAIVNLYRTGDFRQFTRFDFATEEISAREGSDYQGTGGTITFRPGEGYKRIEIRLISDDEAETNEAFRIRLTKPSANTLLMHEEISVLIEDAPAAISPPTLQIAAAEGGNILLSWEGDPAWKVEGTAEAAKGKWEVVVCKPTTTGKRCEVTVSASSPLVVYRLRAQ